jgi:hypothetical protein
MLRLDRLRPLVEEVLALRAALGMADTERTAERQRQPERTHA